ncbi:hypothetical protein UM590_09505 [Staphylococcus aureus]|nr:hypothetical protein UM590_09505 [Staphylococcus aureus]
MPVAMNYLAGGQGAKDYGDVKNILLGLMTLIIILVLQRFTTGFIKEYCHINWTCFRNDRCWLTWDGRY